MGTQLVGTLNADSFASCSIDPGSAKALGFLLPVEHARLVFTNEIDADRQQWWRRYKYDIPVLHIDGKYWAKHKITLDEAIGALGEARAGRCARVPQAPRPPHPASSLPGPQHSVIVADVARFGNLNAARPLTLSSLADAFSAAPTRSQVGRPAGRAGC